MFSKVVNKSEANIFIYCNMFSKVANKREANIYIYCNMLSKVANKREANIYIMQHAQQSCRSIYIYIIW